eukprot:IDg6061t1
MEGRASNERTAVQRLSTSSNGAILVDECACVLWCRLHSLNKGPSTSGGQLRSDAKQRRLNLLSNGDPFSDRIVEGVHRSIATSSSRPFAGKSVSSAACRRNLIRSRAQYGQFL